MTRKSPTRKCAPLAALLLGAALIAFGRHAEAASILLPNGEPDPNCPELRLWLRADSGIQDAEGHGPEDPDFSGFVAAWRDRSPQKFDLGASPAQAPVFVARQPAAGNQPTVAFSGAQVLARTNCVLYDRPTSTMILVVQGRSRSNCIYSVGKAQHSRERLGLDCTPETIGGLPGLYMMALGERGYGLNLGLPGDGYSGGRFAVIVSNGEADRRTLTYRDGAGEIAGGQSALVMDPMASDKCSREFSLGGGEGEFFTGQIAETIVFDRGLSPAERRDLAKYLCRRYELDWIDAFFPNTFALRADDFTGTWRLEALNHPDMGRDLGNRCVVADGKAVGDAMKATLSLPRGGVYHVWVRAENRGRLRTTVQGAEFPVTHVRGTGDIAWIKAGEIEMKAGSAEVSVRCELPGARLNAVLVSPTADTADAVDDICFLAWRLRRMRGEDRLVALFDNGLRLDGSLVTGWRSTGRLDPAAMPALACIQFAARNERPASAADSMIELHNGDRLRGAISGYVPAAAQAGKTGPARLLIQPPQGFFEKRDRAIAVDIDWVRRIVFETSSRDRRCPPQTLVCRNGRTLAFTALRWGEQSLSLLTDNGVEQVALRDVAEVRMATVDAWDRYYRELAIIDPEVKAGIVRVETSEGMTLTGAPTRSPQVRAGEPPTWARFLQPVWSREPIPVPWANTRLLWRAPAHVAPLARFAPDQVNQRGMLGSSWKWQADRNVAGGPLRSGGLDYLWGFGVHAPNEMVFQLPDCVRAVRTGVGIDSAVGSSGCSIAKIYANQAIGKPLYESKPLVGLSPAASTGEVALPATSGAKRQLILSTESAGDLGPERGDPLDIGNHVDWLEPVLLLDPALLREEVEKRLLPK